MDWLDESLIHPTQKRVIEQSHLKYHVVAITYLYLPVSICRICVSVGPGNSGRCRREKKFHTGQDFQCAADTGADGEDQSLFR